MFDAKALEQLGSYVYALFDSAEPNWPFYIGKGSGNRVFSHAAGGLADEEVSQEPMSPKAKAIDDIKRNGRQVIQKVIRYGLSPEEALSVEGALIDVVNHIKPETLTNQISSPGAAEGIIDANDLAVALCAEPLSTDLPVLLIKIERRWTKLLTQYSAANAIPPNEIYDAVRGNWKVSIRRAENAQCVLAVARGLVRGAYIARAWDESGEEGRNQFEGVVASEPFKGFIGKSVVSNFVRGSQNPIRYLNC